MRRSRRTRPLVTVPIPAALGTPARQASDGPGAVLGAGALEPSASGPNSSTTTPCAPRLGITGSPPGTSEPPRIPSARSRAVSAASGSGPTAGPGFRRGPARTGRPGRGPFGSGPSPPTSQQTRSPARSGIAAWAASTSARPFLPAELRTYRARLRADAERFAAAAPQLAECARPGAAPSPEEDAVLLSTSCHPSATSSAPAACCAPRSTSGIQPTSNLPGPDHAGRSAGDWS